MIPTTYKVLLVEDDEDDYILAKSLLGSKHVLIWAQTLSSALQCLRENAFDVVLLDLTIPGSRGLETFDKLRAYAASVPIVMLTGMSDDSIAAEAVEKGAQDYLIKGNITAALLERSLKYSILRKRAEKDARKLERLKEREDFVAAFTDDLHNPLIDTGRILEILAKTNTNNLSEEQAKCFAELSEKNAAVQKILRHLLDVYRYEKKSDVTLENTDFSALAHDCVNELRNATSGDGVEIKADLAPSKAVLSGNPKDLRRALAGVLESAIEMVSPSPGAINVTLSYRDKVALFQVSGGANGVPGSQGNGSRPATANQNQQANSLNMYLCKQIIRVHGGTLKSEILPDRQVTLTVTLPMNKSLSVAGV